MNKEEKKEIQFILDSVFGEIRIGHIERAWEVYDEFEKMLKKLMDKDNPSTQMKDFIYKWIDIKDELPQPFKTVFIKKGNNVVKAYRGFDEETLLDTWYDDEGNMYDGSYNLWSYSYN